MKRSVLAMLAALTLLTAALPASATVPAGDLAPLHRATGEAVPGSYIVVLEQAVRAAGVAASSSVTPDMVFEHAIDGFAARLDARQLDQVRRHPHVAYVEEDQVATVASFVQQGAPWHLDRIDQVNPPLDGLYHWTANTAGVDAYVIDTGIDTSHLEFTHRASVLYDALGGNGQDCHGHGTHVAGTIGALTYGVAKTVKLWAVRAMNCFGSGTYAGLIAATDYVRWHSGSSSRPGVANYSLDGGYSAALNNAVSNLAASGVFVVAAAGHSGADACNYSPGSAPGVMTVGSTDGNDQRTPWTNYGPCVEIYAPGVNIISTWLGGGTRTLSGTSYSAPQVAGVGALAYASGHSPFAWILANAVPRTDGGGSFLLLHKAGL